VWAAAALAVVGLAIGLRSWMLFRTAIPPGMDAGYYPLQTRTLLAHGRLAYDDVPLRFAIDAVVAMGAMSLGGRPLDDAVLWASRIVDAVVQPFAALALVAIGFAWSRGRRSAVLPTIAAAAIVVLARPILDMVGDFEKQSMALVWTSVAWWATWAALGRSNASAFGPLAVALLCLVLAAGTHVGTAAGALFGTVAVVALWLLLGRPTRKQVLVLAVCLLATTALAAVTMSIFAPAKATALLRGPLLMIGIGSDGTGRVHPVAIVAAVVGVGLLLWWSRTVLERMRHGQPDHGPLDHARRADAAFLLGMATTAAFLFNPMVPGEYAERLRLIGWLPLAFVVLGLLVDPALSNQPLRRANAFAVVVLVGLALVAPGARPLHMQPLISEEGLAELRGWRDELGTSLDDVVVARHGLEWWAGFAMHSAVRMGAPKTGDATKYRRVFFLEELHPTAEPGRQGTARGPRRSPGGGPPANQALAPIPSDAVIVREGHVFRLHQSRQSQ
jgi:hypothetical protein